MVFVLSRMIAVFVVLPLLLSAFLGLPVLVCRSAGSTAEHNEQQERASDQGLKKP